MSGAGGDATVWQNEIMQQGLRQCLLDLRNFRDEFVEILDENDALRHERDALQEQVASLRDVISHEEQQPQPSPQRQSSSYVPFSGTGHRLNQDLSQPY